MREAFRKLRAPFRWVKMTLFVPWADWQDSRTYQEAWDKYHRADKLPA
ncbi:MAG: hypothetical protein UY99_C0038G0009 [Parcubacteria group bacterium GW2011_GWA1_59_11]|nr:MAG: hypothetical protein UY99_C0038G0009 [Parcubacteria group bacterium GW2011_GWA1_59_11]